MSSSKLIQDIQQWWRHSYVGSRVSHRFVKFLVVGGIGVFVNLLAMALVMRLTDYRDWRASSMASAIAALHNYWLNNLWTFRDRTRTGFAWFSGAFVYLPMAAVGIAITTLVYSLLTGRWLGFASAASPLYLLGSQLVAILFGTYLNYTLNRSFTWPGDHGDGIKLTSAALQTENRSAGGNETKI